MPEGDRVKGALCKAVCPKSFAIESLVSTIFAVVNPRVLCQKLCGNQQSINSDDVFACSSGPLNMKIWWSVEKIWRKLACPLV